MPRIQAQSKSEFILQFSCDVLLALIENSDNPSDQSLSVIAVQHAANLIDAFEHLPEIADGAH